MCKEVTHTHAQSEVAANRFIRFKPQNEFLITSQIRTQPFHVEHKEFSQGRI